MKLFLHKPFKPMLIFIKKILEHLRSYLKSKPRLKKLVINCLNKTINWPFVRTLVIPAPLKKNIATDNINKFETQNYCTIYQSSTDAKEITSINTARTPQIFLDVSALVCADPKTGIQRVVRAILHYWLTNPIQGYKIEPVYSSIKLGYGYYYTSKFNQDLTEVFAKDEPIQYHRGDRFVGLDLNPTVILLQKYFYQELRQHGVSVQFIIYDLLPINLARTFPKQTTLLHKHWLHAIADNDGGICISNSVASEMREWLKLNRPERLDDFKISWFHLGADIHNSIPTTGIPQDANSLLNRLQNQTNFLMVGTIEPRKGHVQVLAAFELLWRQQKNFNLIIIGKNGWMMDAFIKTIKSHPQLAKRLIWLDGISDEYMEKIYAYSSCLLAASEGEGFGLPLIEAARHKLPIIARDIPVFREVAGAHAFYFKSTSPKILAEAINSWAALAHAGNMPQSNNMPWLSWAQSADQLWKNCIEPN